MRRSEIIAEQQHQHAPVNLPLMPVHHLHGEIVQAPFMLRYNRKNGALIGPRFQLLRGVCYQ